MNNTQFTPGPWELRLITSGDKPAHPVYWNINAPHARAAIQVYKQPKATLKEAEANANLIAAAPDMYEALKIIIRRFKNDTLSLSDITRAESAVSKANPNREPKVTELSDEQAYGEIDNLDV